MFRVGSVSVCEYHSEVVSGTQIDATRESAWVITQVGMWFIHSDDPEYQQYRKNGGDPFFDSLPRPLNPTPDSERFRAEVRLDADDEHK